MFELMDNQNLRQDELVTHKLRKLFEQRGFQRVKVGKFEEYDFYIDNKNFLQSDQMITFMDMDGRLMALRPDVTLSIVKNIPVKPLPVSQKLYYIDEVYRASRESGEYKAFSQLGIECIGDIDMPTRLEVVDLALQSLESIARDSYVLDLSHLGFVGGLLEYAGLGGGLERRIIRAIQTKSGHDVAAILLEAEICEETANRILALLSLDGKLGEVLEKARGLVVNDAMQQACDELALVAKILEYNGYAGKLNLDFSVMGALDYYNGLIFNGYVEGLPQKVLTGGQYDNLMKKMHKSCGAIGFAVYIDQLNTYFKSGRQHDFDLLIVYDAHCDICLLLKKVRELTKAGTSIRLERSDAKLENADFTYSKMLRFTGADSLTEGDAVNE